MIGKEILDLWITLYESYQLGRFRLSVKHGYKENYMTCTGSPEVCRLTLYVMYGSENTFCVNVYPIRIGESYKLISQYPFTVGFEQILTMI